MLINRFWLCLCSTESTAYVRPILQYLRNYFERHQGTSTRKRKKCIENGRKKELMNKNENKNIDRHLKWLDKVNDLAKKIRATQEFIKVLTLAQLSITHCLSLKCVVFCFLSFFSNELAAVPIITCYSPFIKVWRNFNSKNFIRNCWLCMFVCAFWSVFW